MSSRSRIVSRSVISRRCINCFLVVPRQRPVHSLDELSNSLLNILSSWIAPDPDSSQAVIDLERDFSNVKKDESLAEHVQPVLNRLDTFKTPVHPRIRLFYELLKKDITNYVHRTSDTLYNVEKFNVYVDNKKSNKK